MFYVVSVVPQSSVAPGEGFRTKFSGNGFTDPNRLHYVYEYPIQSKLKYTDKNKTTLFMYITNGVYCARVNVISRQRSIPL